MASMWDSVSVDGATMKLYLSGCSTGRSAGLAPLALFGRTVAPRDVG
jgi:hypothetical protein